MLCSTNDKMAARLMLYMGVGRLRSHHRRKMARSGGWTVKGGAGREAGKQRAGYGVAVFERKALVRRARRAAPIRYV
jgi:hypothetical protein